MIFEGSDIGLLVITATSHPIKSSIFSVKNTGAGNVILRSNKPVTVEPPNPGVTSGSIALKPGDIFNWNSGLGIKTMIVDASASIAEVAFN